MLTQEEKKEKKNAYYREYYKDPERHERQLKRMREYSAQHRNELNQYGKKYYQENIEIIKTKAKEYRDAHREEISEYAREYRESEHGNQTRKEYMRKYYLRKKAEREALKLV